ncbi:MAG TPA: corrinoid protein [Anaerolineales bacterium]|nr:corrinoid protein [Anaerolineales bacterium]
MTVLDDLCQSVIDGNRNLAQELVKKAIAENIPPEQILKEGLIRAMAEVGRKFECGEYFVPEMLIAARAMQNGLSLLRPHLVTAKVAAVGKVVIGTVQGDLHDIGKNLVAMMLEGAGFEVIDLGVDVSPGKYVQAVKDHHPDLIACSALLTTTMPRMKDVVDALKENGLRDQVKVMVGGAPVTEVFANQIGADACAMDAAVASSRAQELILERRKQ